MADINPRVDIAFKKIFGVEENKELTISLINSIVSKQDQVSDITILNPYNVKNFRQDKLSILDIKATSTTGKLFNIEMQISDEDDYDKRALYYWARLYTQQLKSGDRYDKLSKAIGIHILNFTSIPEVKKYHNKFRIKSDDGVEYFNNLELHTIELDKFTTQLHTSDDRSEFETSIKNMKEKLDIWSTFLTDHNLLNKAPLPDEFIATGVAKALTILDIMNLTEDERETYEGRLSWLRIEGSTLDKRFKQGEAKGLVEGEAKGKAKGKVEGKAEGQKQMVAHMLKHGIKKNAIAKMTGLSLEDIDTWISD